MWHGMSSWQGARVACALLLVCALSAPARGLADEPAGPASATVGVRAHLVTETTLDDSPGKKLSMVHVTFEPGGTMGSHQHGGPVLVYVIAGAIRSQVGDGPSRVYHAGESWIEAAGVQHNVCQNASATEAAELVACLVVPATPAAEEAAPADTLAPSGRHH